MRGARGKRWELRKVLGLWVQGFRVCRSRDRCSAGNRGIDPCDRTYINISRGADKVGGMMTLVRDLGVGVM